MPFFFYLKTGYTGDYCEQDIDECLSSPCKNGGSCQNLENNYECTCMKGFEGQAHLHYSYNLLVNHFLFLFNLRNIPIAGKDCSIDINECESNPCASGSTCMDRIATYSCICQEGLTGTNCEIDINDCEVRYHL